MFSVSLGIGALIAGVAAAAASVYNANQTKKANEANIEATEEQNAINRQWTEEQNEITRAREDNALQRKVNDAQQAGLSPLAAISGQGSSAGMPLNWSGQAGYVQPTTLDWSGVTSMLDAGLTDQVNLRQQDLTYKSQSENQKNQLKMTMLTTANNTKIAKMQIQSAQKINDATLKQRVIECNAQIQQFDADMRYKYTALSEDSFQASSAQFHDLQRDYTQTQQRYYNTLGYTAPRENFSDIKKYQDAVRANNAAIAAAESDIYEYTKGLSPDEIASFWSEGKSSSSGYTDAASADINFSIVGGGGSKTNAQQQSSSSNLSKDNTYAHNVNAAYFYRLHGVKLVTYTGNSRNYSYK